MSESFFPAQVRLLEPTRCGSRTWVCCVQDFFKTIIYRASGETRGEARDKARAFRTGYRIESRHCRDRMATMKGKSWKERS